MEGLLQFVEGAPVDAGKLLAWVQAGPEATLSPSGVVTMPVSVDPAERLEEVAELLHAIRATAGDSTPAA